MTKLRVEHPKNEHGVAQNVVRLPWPLDRLETQGKGTLRVFWASGESDCYNPKTFRLICTGFELLVKEGHLR